MVESARNKGDFKVWYVCVSGNTVCLKGNQQHDIKERRTRWKKYGDDGLVLLLVVVVTSKKKGVHLTPRSKEREGEGERGR